MKTEKTIDVRPIDDLIRRMASREIEVEKGIVEFAKIMSKGDQAPPSNGAATPPESSESSPRRARAAAPRT